MVKNTTFAAKFYVMEMWKEIVLLSCAVVLASGFFRMLWLKGKEMKQKDRFELKIAALKIIMPLKVQAYERLLLYLERAQLPVLVKRIYVPGMEKGAFHLGLLQSVREEFEHNMAQQLYVSPSTWNAVKNAKEELVNQINSTFEQLTDEDTDILAQTLVALPNPSVDQAVAILKDDFGHLL